MGCVRCMAWLSASRVRTLNSSLSAVTWENHLSAVAGTAAQSHEDLGRGNRGLGLGAGSHRTLALERGQCGGQRDGWMETRPPPSPMEGLNCSGRGGGDWGLGLFPCQPGPLPDLFPHWASEQWGSVRAPGNSLVPLWACAEGAGGGQPL